MKYASLFTGVGGFEKAIHDIYPNAKCVFYSEIDKAAEKTFLKNFPENEGKNIGDIEKVAFDIDFEGNYSINEERIRELPDFDLLVGGSPCQDLSIAKANRAGLEGLRSRLFFAYSAILRIKKPKYFILENVASMSSEARDKMTAEISKSAGYEVNPILINSALVSAQKRKRLYWTNWEVSQPKDRGVTAEGILAWSRSTRYKFLSGDELIAFMATMPDVHFKFHGGDKVSYVEERTTRDGKANTLTTGEGCGSFSSKNYMEETLPDGTKSKRLITPEEAEELQTFPVGWTEGVSKANRYKQMGNAVNVETIKHMLQELKMGEMNARQVRE